jgi:hypothetical protein
LISQSRGLGDVYKRQSLENATTIQVDYLDTLLQYNTTQLELYYPNF